MPFTVENWAEALTVLVTAVTGGYGAAKLQQRGNRSRNGSDDPNGAMLSAIEQLGTKIDGVGRQVGGVKLSVEGLVEDMDRAKYEISRLKPVVGGLSERVEAVETRLRST